VNGLDGDGYLHLSSVEETEGPKTTAVTILPSTPGTITSISTVFAVMGRMLNSPASVDSNGAAVGKIQEAPTIFQKK